MEKVEIIGQKIVNIRRMTSREAKAEGWYRTTTVLVLENGIKLYASRDSEGNDAGAMFGDGPGGSFSLNIITKIG